MAGITGTIRSQDIVIGHIGALFSRSMNKFIAEASSLDDTKPICCRVLEELRFWSQNIESLNFKELESTLYDQTNFEENCTASQLENALCFVDPDIGPGELKRVLEMCFPMKGKVRTETNTIRNIMTFMQQGVGRKSKAANWKKVGHASGAIKKAKGKKGRRSSTKKLL